MQTTFARAPYSFLRDTIRVLVCEKEPALVEWHLSTFGSCHLFDAHSVATLGDAAARLGVSGPPPHVCFLSYSFGAPNILVQLAEECREQTVFVWLGRLPETVSAAQFARAGVIAMLESVQACSPHIVLTTAIRAFMRNLMGSGHVAADGMGTIVDALFDPIPASVSQWAAAAGTDQRTLQRSWQAALGIPPLHMLSIVQLYEGALRYFEGLAGRSGAATTQILDDPGYESLRRYWDTHERELKALLGRQGRTKWGARRAKCEA